METQGDNYQGVQQYGVTRSLFLMIVSLYSHFISLILNILKIRETMERVVQLFNRPGIRRNNQKLLLPWIQLIVAVFLRMDNKLVLLRPN